MWDSERLQKEWCSPIYAFFQPTPRIIEINGRRAHEFKCSGRGCKSTVRRFLDKKDAYSTGNMRKHVKTCWGADVLAAADSAKDLEEVRTQIVKDVQQNGSITAAFERKNINTFSHLVIPFPVLRDRKRPETEPDCNHLRLDCSLSLGSP